MLAALCTTTVRLIHAGNREEDLLGKKLEVSIFSVLIVCSCSTVDEDGADILSFHVLSHLDGLHSDGDLGMARVFHASAKTSKEGGQ